MSTPGVPKLSFLAGSVRVSQDGTCGDLGFGETFGEMALLNAEKPNGATVVGGRGGAELITLERRSLQHLRAQVGF